MDVEAIEKSCKYLNQLFIHTIENMKSGFNIWKDFTYKAAKLHVALRSICSTVSSFLEAFQKMADLATNAKGATKEIGVALTRLCLRHRNIEKKLDHVTHTFESSLIGPIEEKLEEWKKLVFQIEKDHTRESKKAIRDYKKVCLQAEKIEKKNKKDANLLKELTSLNQEKREKLVAMETIEKSSVRSALLEERRRHCHVVLAMKPFVDAEMALLSDLVHLEEIMTNLSRHAQEPNILPNSCEQVILDITSQIVPEGWSCQSTRSFPAPSDSLLSLSSVYSNRSSIISEFETQSAIADLNLNASLSSLPVSLLRNQRAGGSVPPPLDRGCSRNGRPLFRQSLYNPMSGSQSSSAGIAYLQQQQQTHQQRQKQLENGSRLLFPSTSAPTTPEVKLQPNMLTSQCQQKVVGKPPAFPPSYLRRKGSFGRALHPAQSTSSFSSASPVLLPSFQSNWDSDRPRSLALASSGQNQFSEQTICSLAPPSSQNPSLSSTSTLKDDDENDDDGGDDDDDQNTLRRPTDTLRKVVSEATESSSNASQNVVSQSVAPLYAVPAKIVSPTRNQPCEPINQSTNQSINQSIQKHTTPSESRNGRNEYASPKIISPRKSLPTNQQRLPYAVPPQIIDGYKIHAENKNTPQSINYVDFHALSSSSGVQCRPGSNGNAAKSSNVTNQVFINMDTNSTQSSPSITSPPHFHSKPQNVTTTSDVRRQQHLAQLESEPHAYGIFMGKPVYSASFDQHFQEKLLMFSPHLDPHGIIINPAHHPPHVKCSPGAQHPHRGHASPSTKRQLPPNPQAAYNNPQTAYNNPQTTYNNPQATYNNPQTTYNKTSTAPDRRFEGQSCPWTLRACSPDRSGSATPTNEINLPPPPSVEHLTPRSPPSEEHLTPRSPPSEEHLTPRSPLVYAPQTSQFNQPDQQLPKGFVKHWENSV